MPEKDMQETYVRWLRQAASRPNNNDEIYKHMGSSSESRSVAKRAFWS